jgi:hypothetical protein
MAVIQINHTVIYFISQQIYRFWPDVVIRVLQRLAYDRRPPLQRSPS